LNIPSEVAGYAIRASNVGESSEGEAMMRRVVSGSQGDRKIKMLKSRKWNRDGTHKRLDLVPNLRDTSEPLFKGDGLRVRFPHLQRGIMYGLAPPFIDKGKLGLGMDFSGELL
jgi:hypothetical protein